MEAQMSVSSFSIWELRLRGWKEEEKNVRERERERKKRKRKKVSKKSLSSFFHSFLSRFRKTHHRAVGLDARDVRLVVLGLLLLLDRGDDAPRGAAGA